MAEPIAVDHPALSGIRLCLGGNVFGWTIDSDQGFRVLDAFYEAGGRMIDTAEGYSNWVPGNQGGESETIIGAWLESRGVRKDMRVATKVGQSGAPGSLKPEAVAAALEGSLERLRTDYLDLYYAHRDDGTTPLDEVVSAFDSAFQSGKVREIGASNYTPERLADALATAERLGAQGFTVGQYLYNLLDRDVYEGSLQDLCVNHGIAMLPYSCLASGFLTGKYRSAADWQGTARAFSLEQAEAAGGWAVLERLDAVVKQTGHSHSRIALAWLNAKQGIAAPVASATSPEQLADLVAGVAIQLTPEQIALLDGAKA